MKHIHNERVQIMQIIETESGKLDVSLKYIPVTIAITGISECYCVDCKQAKATQSLQNLGEWLKVAFS